MPSMLATLNISKGFKTAKDIAKKMLKLNAILFSIAFTFTPLVALSEQIQTYLIQIPIMDGKKAELEAMLFSPEGVAFTEKQKGFLSGESGYTKDRDGNLSFVIWSKWETREDYTNYLSTPERSEGSKFVQTMMAVIAGPPSVLWVEKFQDK